MLKDKRVLLIAGGGTLGTYVSEELLRLGATVEVICPEEKHSDNDRLLFHQSLATEELLNELFSKQRYDGIVNFIHYKQPEEYRRIHPLLIAHTDHLIFLSSYRVYADQQHPITEEAPHLLDVVQDAEFLEKENYALPKSKCEQYLKTERAGEPWTIIRPVISFSQRRLDLLMYSADRVVKAANEGQELLLPQMARDFQAGLDWAGNSGKLIANLLFKEEAMGECFSIYSGHGMSWGEVAEVYQRVLGLKIRWCSEEEYLQFHHQIKEKEGLGWMWFYDRRFCRDVDCSKVMRVTGLSKEDFATVEEGLRCELDKLSKEQL